MAISETISTLLRMAGENSDPRTMKWFFVPSPLPLLVVTTLYLAIVYFGPKVMASRPAFQLRYTLIAYNFTLVILSAWMVYEFAATSLFNPGFNVLCQTVDYSEDPMAVRLANVIWWYYISKIIEFLDTIFFILRKKNNQVSFLHVYHHSTMPLLWYIGVRYLAGGGAFFCAMVNSFIHVLMYAYYFLSAFGPRMQPFLWWKRYITTLQLVQFNLIMLHTFAAYYINCGFPRVYMVALVLYCVSHVVLFSNFFYQNYIAKGKGRKSVHKDNALTNGQQAVKNGHVYDDIKANGLRSRNNGKINNNSVRKEF